MGFFNRRSFRSKSKTANARLAPAISRARPAVVPVSGRPIESLEARQLFAIVSASLQTMPSVTDPNQLVAELKVVYTPQPIVIGAVTPRAVNALELDSLDQFDLEVLAPNQSISSPVVTDVDEGANPSVDPTIVTYSFVAPGGKFDPSDNGTYTVFLRDNEVFDIFGNPIPSATLGTFTVTVPPPPPVSWTGNNANAIQTDFFVEATWFQPDGKLLAAGSEQVAYAGDPDGDEISELFFTKREVLRRFNPDGSNDTTFGGGDGRVEAGDMGKMSAAYGIFRQGDGKILVASAQAKGSMYDGAEFVLRRFHANGDVDNGFGSSGAVKFHFVEVFDPNLGFEVSLEAIPYAIAFQSDGKIVIAGHTFSEGPGGVRHKDFALARLNPDGTFDDGGPGDSTPGDKFGTIPNSAAVITDLSGNKNDSIGSITIMPDGDIVVAGEANGKAGVAWYTKDGKLDTQFNGTGFKIVNNVTTKPGDFTVGLASRSDGAVVIAGASANGSDFAMTKLKPDGSVDTGFGSGGLATADFGGTDDADRVLSLTNGKILVVGTSKVGNTYSTAVAQFNANGTVDTFFDSDGKMTFDPVTINPVTSFAPAVGGGISVFAATPLNQLILRANATFDGQGNVVVGRNSSEDRTNFRRLVPDRAAPAAALSPISPVTIAGGATLTFTVTYTDDAVLNANSIDIADLVITRGAEPPLVITGVTKAGGGQSVTATYTVAAPGGTWDVADNGDYAIALLANQVLDGSNNAVAAATLGTFSVNIAVAGAGPGASLTSVPPILTAGGASVPLTVTYVDDVAVDPATIDVGDIVVTGPGGTPLTVTGVTTSSSANVLTAIYTVAAPGGAFDAGDNGVYTVTTVAGQVLDTGGTGNAAATLGTFTVGISGAGGVVEPTGPLEGRLVLTAPPAAVGGQKAKKVKAKIVVTNRSGADFRDEVTVQLLLSADNAADATTDATVSTAGKTLRIKDGKSKTLKLKIGVLPALSDGTYNFVAIVNGPAGASDWAFGPSIVVAAPFIDLAATTPAARPNPASATQTVRFSTRVENRGNVLADANADFLVRLLPAGDGAPVDVGTGNIRVKIKPGAGKVYKARLPLPAGLTPGTYTLQVTLDPTAAIPDPARDNNLTVGSITIL